MMIRNIILLPRFAIFVNTSNHGLRHHLGLNEGPTRAAILILYSVVVWLLSEDHLPYLPTIGMLETNSIKLYSTIVPSL